MLGDNVLVGSGLGRKLSLIANDPGCHIFAYEVEDPTKYGNIRFRKDGSIRDVVEKPKSLSVDLQSRDSISLMRLPPIEQKF